MQNTYNDTLSEIIGNFSISELKTLFEEQIENADEDYITAPKDHFQPIYNIYLSLDKMVDEDQDDIAIAKEKFIKICRMIIDLICDKFEFDIDPDYLDDNASKVPGICFALYTFFVLDFYTIVSEILTTYIKDNLLELYSVFTFTLQNKDAVTVSNKKVYGDEMSSILSNIYDVTDYAFTNIDYEYVLKNLDQDYPPLLILAYLYNKSFIGGDFVRVMADIYKVNIALKSSICFDISNKIKNGQIVDIFKETNKEEE